jgi:uncharacterized membrane protein YgcG
VAPTGGIGRGHTVSRRTTLLTAAVIAATVFAGSTPVQAADASAVKRAIVITVLNNLGVQPATELLDSLVADIPMDLLDSRLVRRVGTALDTNGDAAQIISQTVDSDGDRVPNENGASDASSEDGENDESSGSNSGTSSSGGGTSTRPPNNSDDGDEEDDEDKDDDEDDEDKDDDEDGDDEDN